MPKPSSRLAVVAESMPDRSGNKERRGCEWSRSQYGNGSQTETCGRGSGASQKSRDECQRKETTNRCQSKVNQENSCQVPATEFRKNDSLKSNRPWPHRGFQSSRHPFADVCLGVLPIAKMRLSGCNALLSLLKNSLVPRGRIQRVGVAAQILPECFHHPELLRKGHFI